MAINLPSGLLQLLGLADGTLISLSNGADVYNGTNANEHILGNGGGDTINAGGGSDILEGGAGGDTLNGEDGNDYIEGGIGGDAMIGGAGSDTLGYSQWGSSVKVTLNNDGGGTTSGSGSGPGNHAQGDSINGFENVVGSNFNDTLTGNIHRNVLAGLAGNDTLRGMGGNDILIGGIGADVLDGGSGTDTADYSTSVAPVHLVLGGVSTGGDAQGDTFISIENFVGTAGADVFDGSASLTGFSADGGGGADSMFGGHGNDVLSLGGGAAAVAGFAALQSEGGTLDGGDGNDEITGDDADNEENGGEGNDIMRGRGGHDDMDGGGGHDSMSGEHGGDRMYGGFGNDYIDGGEDDDYIDDGEGDDTVSGGEGNDTFNTGEGVNSFDGGFGDDTINMNLNDALNGDTSQFNGGEGQDSMDFRGASSGVELSFFDAPSLAASAATPIQMRMTIGGEARDYISIDIEVQILTQFNDGYLGNSDNNIVFGMDGDDVIFGGRGNDFISGGFGNDRLSGGEGNDLLVAGLGVDGGDDVLSGEAGSDTFQFDSVDELSPSPSMRKFIIDFSVEDGDVINLSRIEPDTTTGEFQWIGDDDFSGRGGELRFTPGTDDLVDYNIVEGDTDGDGGSDLAIYVNKSAGNPDETFFVL